MFEISAHKNRTADHTITLYQADGTGFALSVADKVRVKIGRGGDASTPSLDVDSVGALAGGSLVTITQIAAPAVCTLRLGQADLLNLKPGVYDVELIVVDADDSQAAKHVEDGVLHLHPSMGGDIGLT